MDKLIHQVIRFGFVGALCFFIDYFLMIFMTDVLNINYLISSGISFSVSVIINYILSTKFVFVSEKKSDIKGIILFVFLSFIGLLLNSLIMWISVDILKSNYKISKIIATGIVMVYNFISRKLLIEK